MASIKLLLLQAVLCAALVYGEPPKKTIYISKISTSRATYHRLTESRQLHSEWNQITGENRQNGEFSLFKAYSTSFEEEDIGSLFTSNWIGGFTRKMRVCKLRHSSGDDMFILTWRECSYHAARNRIGEELNFYVSDHPRSKYSTSKIYYASCQTRRGYAYTKVSRNSVRCNGDSSLNHGSFHAYIPEGYSCERLSVPQGTTVSYQYEEGRISLARLSCNPGYEIRGSSTIQCGSDGLWPRGEHSCEPITCGDLPLPDGRMTVSSAGPYSYGDWVTYQCPTGYEVFPPEASAQCQSNGRWFHQQAECRPVDCRFPGEPRFGNTIAENGYQLGAEISFECNSGYILEGTRWAVCTDTGRWEPAELPRCREVRCERLSQPENGRHHASNSRFVMGQEVIFQCDSGYSLVGEQILRCEFSEERQTGVWSAPIPVCSQIRCQPPEVPENGKIIGEDYRDGAQIGFECRTGYQLLGAVLATCQSNGQWDAQAPTCRVMQCRDPGIPEHAVRQGNSFTYESVLTYQCDVGYLRYGASTLVCGDKGKWTSSPPRCEPIGCPEVSAPMSGSKEGDTFFYGNKIQFSCFPGYKLIGSNETECLSSGRWSEEKPECQPCPFGEYKSEAGPGGCISCPQRSYTTSEASTSKRQCICEQDTHGPPGGPCEAVKCTYPAAPENGEVKECGTESNDMCLFSCNPGYILRGSRSRTCTPRGWTGHLPVCVACPPNMYKRDEGSLSCTPCPQGTYIPEGTLGLSLDSCQCRPGFQRGANGECEDIDECVVENGGCEDYCENTPGSFECKCTKGGWELNSDGRTCFENQSCSALEDKPNGGEISCTTQDDTNGVFCRIKCHAGFFFVSGMNNYVTCGPETNFEWSHKLVNKTAKLPSCTEEYFVDILLPVKTHYETEQSCNALGFSRDMFFERMRVQQFIDTLHQCLDTSNSGRFCQARNLTLECKEVIGDDDKTKSHLTVAFDVLLKNKEDGAIHSSCTDMCKRQNLRGMLGNAINLTKEIEELLQDKSIGIDTGSDNPVAVLNTGIDRTRPKMFCITPGRVLTRTFLCVPCAEGYYLPDREMDQCLPCPKGSYQDQESQTSCKPCLPGSTTLTDGTTSPHMCNIEVTDYQVNATNSQTDTYTSQGNDDDESTDLDSFGLAF